VRHDFLPLTVSVTILLIAETKICLRRRTVNGFRAKLGERRPGLG
jgi:hypothetical protein